MYHLVASNASMNDIPMSFENTKDTDNLEKLSNCLSLAWLFLKHFLTTLLFFLQTQFFGQSGLVQLDTFGDRTNVEFELRKVENDEDYLLGTWSPSSGLLWSGVGNKKNVNRKFEHLGTEPMIITTVLVSMYLYNSRE